MMKLIFLVLAIQSACVSSPQQVCDKYHPQQDADWFRCVQNERAIRAINYSNSLMIQRNIQQATKPVP